MANFNRYLSLPEGTCGVVPLISGMYPHAGEVCKPHRWNIDVNSFRSDFDATEGSSGPRFPSFRGAGAQIYTDNHRDVICVCIFSYSYNSYTCYMLYVLDCAPLLDNP
jgi:hypothetical protein